jgi:Cu2+-exporting ATPase
VGDRIRADAGESIGALRAAGWDVRILSGDHAEAVRRVGERVGIDAARCAGGATPEEKLAVGEELARRGTVVMVGDGVNDAGALSVATVGVAVHGGADVSMNVSDVYIGRPGLAPLCELFEGARRTRRVIRRNLGASLGYNVVCASLAVAGMISPLLAAILMPASSLTVVVLSYRSRTFEGR